MLIIISEDQLITHICPKLCALTSHSPQRWLGEPIRSLLLEVPTPSTSHMRARWALDPMPRARLVATQIQPSSTAITVQLDAEHGAPWHEHISDAAIFADLDLKISRSNRAAKHLYGQRLAQCERQHAPLSSLLSMRHSDGSTIEDIWHVLSSTGSWRGDILQLTESHGPLRLHTTFLLLHDPPQPQEILVLSRPQEAELVTSTRHQARLRLEDAFARCARHICASTPSYHDALDALRDGLAAHAAILVLQDPLSHQQPELVAHTKHHDHTIALPPHDELWTRLRDGEYIAGPITSLPPVYAQVCAARGTRATIIIPLRSQDLLGYLRFDERRDGRDWHPDDLRLLQAAAELFAAALIRERGASQQRAIEERMMRSQKMESLGLLASGVAHDFNNLLVGVIANAQLVRDELRPMNHLPQLDTLLDPLEDILTAGKRAGELVRQMLTFAGRSNNEITQITPTTLITETLPLLRSSLHPKTTLSLHLDPNTPSIQGDTSQLIQLIMNLLLNANEALQDGRLHIWLRSGACELSADDLVQAVASADDVQPGTFAFIEVEDSGQGITPEQLPRIFDPFYTNKPHGRGLGLAIVLGVTRAHHAALFIKSTPNVGTTIRVTIPTSQAPRAFTKLRSDSYQTLTPAAPLRHHVLIVDDEPVVRSLALRIFERYKIPALTCASGEECISLLSERAHEISLVLLDYSMPGLDGLQVIESLRRRHPKLPIFLSSGYDKDIMELLPEDPYCFFIHKPYTPSTLIKQLQPYLQE